MHYAVLGAGAIGGGVGALFHKAGHRVTLVARGAHLARLRQCGLRLLTPTRDVLLPIPTREAVPDDADLVLLAVKSQDTRDALAGVPRGLPVCCLQNGVSNEPASRERGHPTLGAMVWVPAVHLVPGEVRLHGAPVPGAIDVGCYPAGVDARALALRDALRAAGFRSEARDDVMAWKRTKLLTNLAGSLQVACGQVPHDLFERLAAEGEAVYAAAGLTYRPRSDITGRVELTEAPAGGLAREGGSTWQSARRGRPLETTRLHTDLLEIARRAGVPAPLCERAMNIVGQVETPGQWSGEALRSALLVGDDGPIPV